MRKQIGLLIGMWLLLAVVDSPVYSMGKKPEKASIHAAVPQLYIFNDMNNELQPYPYVEPNKIAVLGFFSYECPYSREVADAFSLFTLELEEEEVSVSGVSSMPYEHLKELKTYQQESLIPFPMVYDKGGVLAYQLDVEKAPEFFVFDADGVFRYRGGFQGMKNAVLGLIYGPENFLPETKAYGCPVPKRDIPYRVKRKKKKAMSDIPQIKPEHILDDSSQRAQSESVSIEVTMANSM